MRATHTFGVLLVSAILCAPALASAETNVSATGSASAPVPTLYSGEQGGTATTAQTATGTPMGRRLPPKPQPPHALLQRNTASGTPGARPLLLASTTKTELRTDMMEKRDAVRANIERERGAIQTERTDLHNATSNQRGVLLRHLSAQMIKRIQAAVDRLSKLADRIDSRIAKLKTQGMDTTEAATAVSVARTKIADGERAITAAGNAVATAASAADATVSSTTPTDAGKPVRDALSTARDAVVAAHKALADAVGALRASVKIETEVTTTTATTSSSTNIAQ